MKLGHCRVWKVLTIALLIGVYLASLRFTTERGAIKDETVVVPDTVFSIGGINTRRSESRNTPTVINAAFTLHNFWDRRARSIFNGVNPHGAGDAGARVLQATGPNHITPTVVRIDNASLASRLKTASVSRIRAYAFPERPPLLDWPKSILIEPRGPDRR